MYRNVFGTITINEMRAVPRWFTIIVFLIYSIFIPLYCLCKNMLDKRLVCCCFGIHFWKLQLNDEMKSSRRGVKRVFLLLHDMMFPVFSDWDEDQSAGVQAPGRETEDAAETWCRCWEGKNEKKKKKVMTRFSPPV